MAVRPFWQVHILQADHRAAIVSGQASNVRPEPDIVGLVYYKSGWFASKEIMKEKEREWRKAKKNGKEKWEGNVSKKYRKGTWERDMGKKHRENIGREHRKEIIRGSIKGNSPTGREDEQTEAFEKSRTSLYKLQFCSFLMDEESNVCRLLCFFSRGENSRTEKAAS